MNIFGGIILAILIFAFLSSMDIRPEKSAPKGNSSAVAAICKSAESKADMAKVRMEYVCKIESNYLVCVKPNRQIVVSVPGRHRLSRADRVSLD